MPGIMPPSPTPPFLTQAAPLERKAGHALLTLALGGGGALLAAMVVGVTALMVAAALAGRENGAGFLAALEMLSQGNRAGRGAESYVFELSLAGLASIAGAGALLAIAARRAGRPMRSFLTIAPRFRWRHALAGLAIFLPVVAVEIGIALLGSGEQSTSPLLTPGPLTGKLLYAGAAVVFLWFAALAEEIIFRGWLLQQTGALTRSLVAVLAVNAVVFSFAHFDPSLGAFITRCALGAGWAWIVLRLGGIELAAGAHFANNLGIALLAQPVLMTAPKPEPFDALSVALQVGTVAALVAGVEWWTRRNSPDKGTILAEFSQ